MDVVQVTEQELQLAVHQQQELQEHERQILENLRISLDILSAMHPPNHPVPMRLDLPTDVFELQGIFDLQLPNVADGEDSAQP